MRSTEIQIIGGEYSLHVYKMILDYFRSFCSEKGLEAELEFGNLKLWTWQFKNWNTLLPRLSITKHTCFKQSKFWLFMILSVAFKDHKIGILICAMRAAY